MTVSSPPDPTRDNTRNTELLRAELPAARYVDESYLRWLYDENPYGPAIQRAVDDDGVRVAHYALIPQRYRGRGGVVPAAFSLHAVVRSGTQRKGYFQQIGAEIYEEAAADRLAVLDRRVQRQVDRRGREVHGVEDARSVAGEAVRADAHRTRRHQHARRRRVPRASDEFGDVTSGLDDFPVDQWTNSYTTEYLRWRLACPSTRYALHADDDLVAITTTDTRFGVRAAVVLKVFRRSGGNEPVTADAMVGAACRFHRAPYAVYAGFNRRVRVRGVQPPRRLQPSPLHLILRSLSPAVDQDTLAVDTFEFLDMDAY